MLSFPTIRRSLTPRSITTRHRLVSQPSITSDSSDTAVNALPIRTRSVLDEDGDTALYTHQDNQDDRNGKPGTIEWAKINDRALYRRLVAEQQKPRCHSRHRIMACVANETLCILPALLGSRPHIHAEVSYLYDLKAMPRLPPHLQELPPGLRRQRTSVKVVNGDALDAALSLELDQTLQDDLLYAKKRALALGRDVSGSYGDDVDCDGETPARGSVMQPRTRKVLLNATSFTGEMGGYWKQGSLATEEERLCFRTSLSLSLPGTTEDEAATEETPQGKVKPGDTSKTAEKTKAAVEPKAVPPTPPQKAWMSRLVQHAEARGWTKTPPLRSEEALYTRDVLVVRNATYTGSTLLDAAKNNVPSAMLPVVSVITMTPVHQPLWRRGNRALPEYALDEDRARMKDKIRLALRIAVANKHDSVVLGTLGCEKNQYLRRPGAMAANPAHAAAACWREVLMESEFSGCGWFRDIRFAVPEERGDDTFNIFHKMLHNLEV